MTKLIKYLRGSITSIVIIFVLLFAQAICDLSLPSYTSQIVNVGISQGGVEYVAPEAIRASQLKNLELFMEQGEYDQVIQSYDLKDRQSIGDAEYKKLLGKYPIIASEPIYVLNKSADKEALSTIMAKPLLMMYGLQMDPATETMIKQQITANMPMPDGVSLDDMDLFDLFRQMGPTAFQQMLDGMNQNPQFAMLMNLDGSMLNQAAVAATKAEYESIGINMTKYQNSYLLRTGGKMLGLALIAMMTAILVTLLASRVAAKVSMDLRSKVFHKVVSFSNAEMDQFSTASLITRSTNDIQQVQMLIVMLLRLVLYAPILGIGGVIKVFQTNTSMAWIIGLAVVLILLLVGILLVVAMPKFNRMQKLVDRLNLVTREILTGLSVIRAFSTEKHEEKRFDQANKDLTKNMLFTNRVMTFMMPLMMLIMNGITVLIIWRGAHGVDLGEMQVGDMMAFMQYAMQIVMSFLMLTMISIMFPRASVSAKRIDEVLTTECVIVDPVKTVPAVQTKGVVSFEHVNFSYPNAEENALHDINFVAQPGKTTAIIGSTGCGKSTLVNLIPRLYDVTEGQILIDGVDVRELSLHQLRDKIGFVPQKGVLFSGTIDSNLRYGKHDASEEEIRKAARIAQAQDFIEGKPDQYESEISQGGSNVSGGQKQRLSIARAIAKDPKIYVFDDSFSALDYKTDVALRRALKNETENSTVIIVAQRISTILHADQIIVLDEGRIAGIGTHRELLNSCDVYRQIALSQLSEQEIEKDLASDPSNMMSSKEVTAHE